MTTIQERKTARFKFLKFIYDATDGSEFIPVDGKVVGKELGIDSENSSNIIQYLIGEGLLEPMGAGLRVVLTHLGIIEIEQVLENPDKPTQHFLPMNIIQITNMNNSVIQQGSNKSNQTVNVSHENTSSLKEFISELKQSIKSLQLQLDQQNELLAEIATLEAQSNSPKPKSSIIGEALVSIRTILEGVTVNLTSPLFQTLLPQLIAAYV